MQVTPKTIKTFACPKCGSRNVGLDASAKWDSQAQDWTLSGTHDNAFCDDCGWDSDNALGELVEVEDTRLDVVCDVEDQAALLAYLLTAAVVTGSGVPIRVHDLEEIGRINDLRYALGGPPWWPKGYETQAARDALAAVEGFPRADEV